MARRNETSWALSEIRTVLNRAKTARDDIVWSTYGGNIVRDEMAWEDLKTVHTHWHGPMPEGWGNPASGTHIYDRDAQAMYDALTLTIEALEPWVGRKKWKHR